MNINGRLEQLSNQRGQLVQRREALEAQIKEVADQILRMDGAILAYQEMAQEEQKSQLPPAEAGSL